MTDGAELMEERLQVKLRGKVRHIVVPGEEEDAAITLAALDDPDNQPLNAEQLAQLRIAGRGAG